MNYVKLDGKKVSPSKIVCVGRNYVEHIKELDNEIPDEPVFFIKPNSSISDHIQFNEQDMIHYEAEISFLILISTTGSAESLKSWVDPVSGIEFVYVPGGCFQMGSNTKE